MMVGGRGFHMVGLLKLNFVPESESSSWMLA